MGVHLQVVIEVTEDGQSIAGSPFVYVQDFQQYDLIVAVESQNDAAYDIFPVGGSFSVVQAMMLMNVDEPVNWRLANQSDAGIPLESAGMLMALGANIAFGGTRNLKINSPDGATRIVGFIIGKGVPLAVPATLLVDERWEANYPTPTNIVIDERWEFTGDWLLYDRHNPSNVYLISFTDPFMVVTPSSGPAVGGILLNDGWSYFIQDGLAQHDQTVFADQRPWDNSHTLNVDNITGQLNYVF